MVEIAVPHRRQ